MTEPVHINVDAPSRIAALLVLRDAIDKEIQADKLEALTFAAEFKVKSFATPLGNVTVANKDRAIGWDDKELVKWVQSRFPDEIEHTIRVRPAFQSVLAGRFVIAGSVVLDSETGEVIDFAFVTAPGEPYITYPDGKAKKAAKATALRLVQDRAPGWARAVLPEIEAS